MAAMMLIREKDRVPLISSGHDWARHFQLIEAALKLRQRHFMFDGEAVVLGPNGVSDFAALHSGKHNAQAQLHSFDMLAAGGADHRQLTLSLRKANLDRLLSRPVDGISMAHYEQREFGPDLFRAACRMRLDGIVSKHRGRAYCGSKCKQWVKVKNRALGLQQRERPALGNSALSRSIDLKLMVRRAENSTTEGENSWNTAWRDRMIGAGKVHSPSCFRTNQSSG